MNRRLLIAFGALAAFVVAVAVRVAQQRAADALPSWDLALSRRLLTQPQSACGPTLTAPGNLVVSDLLAWRTMRDTLHNEEIHDALWWGQFSDGSNQQRWVVTAGRLRTSDSTWTHNYECDGNETRYLVFEHAPRSADLRRLKLGVFQPADAGWTNELHIRTATWRRILRDPPSLAIRVAP